MVLSTTMISTSLQQYMLKKRQRLNHITYYFSPVIMNNYNIFNRSWKQRKNNNDKLVYASCSTYNYNSWPRVTVEIDSRVEVKVVGGYRTHQRCFLHVCLLHVCYFTFLVGTCTFIHLYYILIRYVAVHPGY